MPEQEIHISQRVSLNLIRNMKPEARLDFVEYFGDSYKYAAMRELNTVINKHTPSRTEDPNKITWDELNPPEPIVINLDAGPLDNIL